MEDHQRAVSRRGGGETLVRSPSYTREMGLRKGGSARAHRHGDAEHFTVLHNGLISVSF